MPRTDPDAMYELLQDLSNVPLDADSPDYQELAELRSRAAGLMRGDIEVVMEYRSGGVTTNVYAEAVERAQGAAVTARRVYRSAWRVVE